MPGFADCCCCRGGCALRQGSSPPSPEEIPNLVNATTPNSLVQVLAEVNAPSPTNFLLRLLQGCNGDGGGLRRTVLGDGVCMMCERRVEQEEETVERLIGTCGCLLPPCSRKRKVRAAGLHCLSPKPNIALLEVTCRKSWSIEQCSSIAAQATCK